MSGKFIVFEGIDNSGKTTVSREITKWLQEDYAIKAIMTRHPGSTPIGQEIREILKHSPHPINSNAQALLFAADNSIFMNQVLKPNLEQGNWVIGDRNNYISSLAYQIASGCSWDELDKVHDATTQVHKIDLLLVFKCDYEESQRRRALKGEEALDRFEDAGREYFDKLSACYNDILNLQYERLQKFVSRRNHLSDTRRMLPNAHYIDATLPLQDVIDKVKELITGQMLQEPQA
jgi:dTMP kinase